MEGGGDSGKDDTSEKDMEEEEEECKIQFHFLTTKEQRYHLCVLVSTKIVDVIGKLSSNSSSPKWKRSPEVHFDLEQTCIRTL